MLLAAPLERTGNKPPGFGEAVGVMRKASPKKRASARFLTIASGSWFHLGPDRFGGNI